MARGGGWAYGLFAVYVAGVGQMQHGCVAVFDLDGVLLRTNLIKYSAMLSLFSEYPEQQKSISAYILARGGVPRRDKLFGLLHDLLGVEPSAAMLADYLERYARALEHALAMAPLVEGVDGFLQQDGYTFYVSSSAPEAEVYQQLQRRNLLTYFAAIYGSTTPKAAALHTIRAANPGKPLVFFGDAIGDWDAAQKAGVAFIAVVNECDNFGDHPVIKLSSFTTIAQVEACIQRALAED